MAFALLASPNLVHSAPDLNPVPSRGNSDREVRGNLSMASESNDPDLTSSVSGQLIITPHALHGPRLRLTLPNGQKVTAIRDRVDSDNPNTYAWIGHLAGEPLSRVIFGSAADSSAGAPTETIAGSVDRSAYSPKELWQLLPNQGGTYTFQLSTSQDFTCATGAISSSSRGRATPTGLTLVHSSAADDYVVGQTQPTVVDLLVVYSPAARVRYTQSGLSAMIVQAVADANTTLIGSYANTFIKLVGQQEVAHVESTTADINTVLGRLVVPSDGFLDTVPALRDQYGADVVTLVSEDTGASGVAYIPYISGVYHPEYAYNVINDGSLVGGALTHEIGHNLGCNHDRDHLNSTGQNATPYGFGYQSCNIDALGFRDIMAYECLSGGTSQRISYFSNPWLYYFGRPVGVDYAADPVGASDNARSIRETAPTIAGFRSSVQTLPLGLTGLAATSPAFNQVSLTWATPDSSVAGIEVQRSTDGGINWTTAAAIAGAVSSWIDRPLTANTSYRYRVRGFNSKGSGSFSGVAAATTSASGTPPAAPTNLTGQEVTEGRIDLAWTDAAINEDGYRIERSDNGGAYVVLATLSWDATSFNDGIGLQLGHTYAYRVIAYNSLGDSTASVVSVTILPLPGTPSNFALIPLTISSVQLSWQDNANNESGFVVERSTDGINFLTVATRTANTTIFTNANLVTGTTYYYRVWSQNISGLSPAAAAASLIWGQAPSAPTGLTLATLGSGFVNLSWTDTSANETTFSLERAGSDNIYAVIGTPAANITTFSDTSVASATPYSYRLRAVNPFGNSAYTPPLSVTSQTVVSTIPKAPTGLTTTSIGQTQVSLAWNDLSSDETGFLVERATGAGVFVVLTTAPVNSVAYTDATTSPTTTYTYRVSALNSGGVSSPTSNLTVTTLPLAPSAPTSLVATVVSATQVSLTWVDNSNNETSFSIERGTGAGAWAALASVAANSTTYLDTTAVGGTTYSYRVRAINSGGNSAYTTVATATTPTGPPNAPTTLAATASSSTQINLTWRDKSSNETGFKVERATNGGTFAVLATTAVNAVSYSDPTVTGATTNSYRVSSENASGSSAPTSTVTVTTPLPAPSAPSGLVASIVSAAQVNVSWLDNSSNESSFSLERATGTGSFAVIATLTANTTTYQNTTTVAGATYSYRVRAANAGGNSAYSAVVTVTTPQTLPAAPSTLTTSAISQTQVTLKWKDNSTNETGFKLEYLSGGTWTQVTTFAANTISCTVTGLTSKTAYSFRISAYNSAGTSASVTINVTTL